ncbi:ABC transporter ATP-binding protein [Planctomycetota bacterium]
MAGRAPTRAPERLKVLRLLRRYWRYYSLGSLTLVLVNLCDTALPLLLKVAIDDIVLARGLLPLWFVAALYLGLVLLLGVFRYFWRYYFIGASYRITNETRATLFAHLERLSASYFQKQRTGDIMSRATNDLEAVRFFFAIGLLLALDTTMYLLIIPPAMVALAPRLSLYTLVPLVVIPFFVIRMGRLVHSRFRRVQERFGSLASTVEETVGGVRVVKGFAQEEWRRQQFLTLNEDYLRENMQLQVTQGLFQPAIAFCMAVTMLIVIVSGGRMAIAGTITVGAFVAFQHYLLKLAWPMRAVGITVNLFQRGLASMERVDEILATEPEIRDSQEALHAQGSQAGRVERGELTIENLTFHYPGAVVPALHCADLRVRPGETVALVGPVGAGKSTLLKLIPRLFEAPSGTIRIDGLDVRALPLARLREAIGYVPQETFLFAETVGGNVAFSMPNASLDEIRDAAQRAAILSEIEGIPSGFDAMLGERGINLSGGQRQRVAIARALIGKPRILLLDDCLSAVDTETEAAILKGLTHNREARTTLIASHRLTAIQNADRIVCLDRGRIVEVGTHKELLTKAGLYRMLWERQQLKEALEDTL